MAARKREATDRQVHFKVTNAQWKRLQELAAANGLTPSAYLRQHIATAVAK